MTKSRGRCQHRIAKALLAMLLVAQSLLALNACALTAMHASMPFAQVQMPDDCAGMNKQACLMFYLQSDQAPASIFTDGAVFQPDATVLMVGEPQARAQFAIFAPWAPGRLRSRPPPPHILFCRQIR